MAIAMKLSREAEREVAEIVRQDLAGRFGNALSFAAIRITPAEDEFGDPYHHIEVIYQGDGALLDPAWLNGFYRRNEEKLAEWGVNLTTESYIDKAEYDGSSEPGPVVP